MVTRTRFVQRVKLSSDFKDTGIKDCNLWEKQMKQMKDSMIKLFSLTGEGDGLHFIVTITGTGLRTYF